jgi:hypothetical protein
MKFHLLPLPIWWATQAGEDRARSLEWLTRARHSVGGTIAAKDYKIYCVKQARRYHWAYVNGLITAVAYLKAHDYSVKVSAGVEG